MSALALLTFLYIPYALYIHGRTGLLPLLDYEMPNVRFCVSLTALVSQFWPLPPAVLRYGSFALVALPTLGFLYRDRGHSNPARLDLQVVIAYGLFVLLFFHVNPEYYLWFFPLWLLVVATWSRPERRTLWGALILVSGLAWIYNVLYGVAAVLDGTSIPTASKQEAARLVVALSGGIDPARLSVAVLIALQPLLAGAVLYTYRRGRGGIR
jgi:hypothetical protein